LGRTARAPATPRRRAWVRTRLAGAGLLALLGAAQAAPPPDAATARQRLEHAEQARARALAAQAAAAARAAAAAARAAQLIVARQAAEAKLQAAKAATARAAARLGALDAARHRAAARLEAATSALEPLLPLIERLSLYPAETLLAAPMPPEQSLRGILILRGLTHEIAARAARVTAEQARLDAATAAVAAAAPELAAAEAAQAEAEAALDRQIAAANADRLAAGGEAAAEAREAASEAARAANLRDLLGRLEADRRAAAARAAAHHAGEHASAHKPITGPIRLAAAAHPAHQLLRPVAGHVIRGWGDHTPAGPATGISWRAAPGASVIAPCSGRVLFAAPFHGYGQLLILDCGGGYDAVIAGFAKLDTATDAAVRAGTTLGTLPDSRAHRPKLYMELRRNGEAIDPTPWLPAGI
jgi:murein hydrolase activator